MGNKKRNLIIATLVIVVAGLGVYNGLKILKEETQAYLFGYSLVLMDTTRQVMTDPIEERAPINRYAIGDRDPLTFNPDESLDILIQHERPDQEEQNWLPAPADGFAVTLRLYLPKDNFLNGTWKLPPIERID